MICYCGNLKSYVNCCEKIHKNITNAETAEQLMRSRYSAFVLANGDYLMKSHHSKTRPESEKKSIEAWAKSVNWIKLEIVAITKGLKSDTTGTVTFNAYFYEHGEVDIIHEKSTFIKENNHWKYLGISK